MPIRILEFRSVCGTGGGPDKTILFGTAQTDASRYAITVCYLRNQQDDAYRLDRVASGLPVEYVEVRERHSLDPGAWRQLRHLVRRLHIDIVHAHDYKTNLMALLMSRLEPVIPMSTAHGWVGQNFREVNFYYPADRRLLAWYPRVVAVSSDIREALVRVGAKADRVTVVANGIDVRAFTRRRERQAEARAALGLRPGEIAIGNVGRLEAEKNQELLIRAFARIAAYWPVRLFIAGDGTHRGRLERLASDLGLGDRITLAGQVDDVILFHHALDLFVMSSDKEGLPNAVLEAMALETPVIATDAGGTADLVRSGVDGVIVPTRDEHALVEAMRAALSDRPATDARAASARARVEGEFSFRSRMGRVEAIYDELMDTYPDVRAGQTIWRHADRARAVS